MVVTTDTRVNPQFNFYQIGIVHSPFPEKFGIPRQSNLLDAAEGWIEIQTPWNRQEALQGLEGFSHIWVLFIFHQAQKSIEDWRPTVRPPRKGAKRQGVFATRSPYRPNAIGMSVLKYLGWEKRNGKLMIKVSGLDLVDGTPVVDIKPYLPYADSLPEAVGGFAHAAPASENYPVNFSEQAQSYLDDLNAEYPKFKELIASALCHDPRPVNFGHIEERDRFGLKLYGFDIQWQLVNEEITVISIKKRAK